MSRFCGYLYMGKNEKNIMTVKLKGELLEYELIHVLEFNSTRKRMSVVLRYKNQYILWCKGADSIIFDRMDVIASKNIPETINNLAEYGKIGLRTLLLRGSFLNRSSMRGMNCTGRPVSRWSRGTRRWRSCRRN
jgi:magnesium-transporting ATPase (P-type)